MVVLAVIALLAGMIFPAYLKHREKAKVTLCKSNLKQFVAALNNKFADDGLLAGGGAIPSGVVDLGGQNVVIDGRSGRQDWSAANFYHATSDPGGVGPQNNWYIYSFVFPYIRGMKLSDSEAYDYSHAPGGPPPFVKGEDVTASACYCPSTIELLTVFNPSNRPNRRANQFPPPFKGLHTEPAAAPAIDDARYCTYAMNQAPNISGLPRSQIPGRVTAFSDYNLKVGYFAYISLMYTNRAENEYNFTSPAGANPYYRQGALKNDFPCRTDVGFHHASGKDFSVNLAMYDGRVESVVSNNITNSVYWE